MGYHFQLPHQENVQMVQAAFSHTVKLPGLMVMLLVQLSVL